MKSGIVTLSALHAAQRWDPKFFLDPANPEVTEAKDIVRNHKARLREATKKLKRVKKEVEPQKKLRRKLLRTGQIKLIKDKP